MFIDSLICYVHNPKVWFGRRPLGVFDGSNRELNVTRLFGDVDRFHPSSQPNGSTHLARHGHIGV